MSRLEIRLSGTGGQGLILAAKMLADAQASEGRHVAQSQSYEPTSRGGLSLSDLVSGDGPLAYPLVTGLDLVVILAQEAVPASDGLVGADTLVLVDQDQVTATPPAATNVHQLPLTRTARRLGSPRVANVVSLGALAELHPVCDHQSLEAAVERHTPARFRRLNLVALSEGRSLPAGAGMV